MADFYEGAGTFAKVELFQVNPETGDKRKSGTLASLAGVERALMDGPREAVDSAVAEYPCPPRA